MSIKQIGLSALLAISTQESLAAFVWSNCAGIPIQSTTASSVETGTALYANLATNGTMSTAVDKNGNYTDRWNSADGTSQTEWLQLDFGSLQPVSEIYIQWDKQYATSGKIEGSADGINWSYLSALGSVSATKETRSLAGTYRFIKLTMNSGLALWGYSIREVQVNSVTCSGTSSSSSVLSSSSNVSVSSSGVAGLATEVVIPKLATNAPNTGSEWSVNLGITPTWDEASMGLKNVTEDILQKYAVTRGAPLAIRMDLPIDSSAGGEAYKLDISGEQLTLRAYTGTGLLYGLQTLKQLIASKKNFSAQSIYDYPSSSWRGLMLDIARNFMPLSYLKSTVDRMVTLKLNRLHLHLSDDQGWRIEIKKWPNLHQLGSQSACVGPYSKGSQGYLTQMEYKELVDYATARGVAIVPEIDLPGHTNALASAYPTLRYRNGVDPTAGYCGVALDWPYTTEVVGISAICYSQQMLNMVADIFSEIGALTPTPWIHFGGDEVRQALPTPYATYINSIDSILNTQNKIGIGWEEITQNTKLRPNTIWQLWNRGFTAPNTQWINSMCTNAYIDHPEVLGGSGLTWCNNVVGEDSLYNLKPGTVGMETTLWGERVDDTTKSIDKIYPRLIALAEAAWTPSNQKNYTNYKLRRTALTENWFKNAFSAGIEIATDPVTGIRMSPFASSSRILLYAASGKLVMEMTGTLEETKLPLGLSPGLYFAKQGYKTRIFNQINP